MYNVAAPLSSEFEISSLKLGRPGNGLGKPGDPVGEKENPGGAWEDIFVT